MVHPKSPNNKNTIMSTSEERTMRRKRVVESSSESDDGDCDDEVGSGSESESETSDDYRKLIAKLFPSKYMKKRVSEISSSKKSAKKAIKEDLCEQENDNKKKKKSKKSKIVEEESEEESEEEEEEDERILRKVKEAKKNFNIIFTISDKGNDEDYDSEDDEDYEDDDEEYDSDEEEYEDDDEESEDEDSDDEEDVIPRKKKSKEAPMQEAEMDKSFKLLREQLTKLSGDNPKNAVYKSCLEDLQVREKDERKKLKKTQRKERGKNAQNFRKIVKNKGVLNDFKYFQDKLSLDEQKRVLAEVEEINKITNTM